jgi:pantetheine-phosphate adenylyltransferase
VLVAVNPGKQPLFPIEERVQMVRDAVAAWPKVECDGADGLVIDFARSRGSIIPALRAGEIPRG